MAILTPLPEPNKVISEIIARLYEVKANAWTVQDKGALLAAIKLQLQEQPHEEKQEGM